MPRAEVDPSVLLNPYRPLSSRYPIEYFPMIADHVSWPPCRRDAEIESHKSVPILPAVSAFRTLPALSLLIIGRSCPSLLFSYIYVYFATAPNNRSPVIHFSHPLLPSLCAKL